MMRVIAGAIFAGTVVSMLLWFLLPELVNTRNQVWAKLDLNDPIIAQTTGLGTSIFTVLALVGFLVIGFIVFSSSRSSDQTF